MLELKNVIKQPVVSKHQTTETNYCLIFERPNTNCFTFGEIFSCLLQRIYGYNLLAPPFYERIYACIKKNILQSKAIDTSRFIIYNLLTFHKQQQKLPSYEKDAPFALADYILDCAQLRVYGVPLAMIPETMRRGQDEHLTEYNMRLAAPECLLNLQVNKSSVWSIGVVSVILTALLRLAQACERQDRRREALEEWRARKEARDLRRKERQEERLRKQQEELQKQENSDSDDVTPSKKKKSKKRKDADKNQEESEPTEEQPSSDMEFDLLDLRNSLEQIFELLRHQYMTTQEIFDANTKILQAQKQKLDPLANDFNITPAELRCLITAVRFGASMSADIQSIPDPKTANELLLDYMDSKNVQRANFVLQHALLQPFQNAQQQEPQYRGVVFQNGNALLMTILDQLDLSSSQHKRLSEFVNSSVIFCLKKRADVSKLLKLSLFRNCSERGDEIHQTYIKNQELEMREQLLSKRQSDREFRARPWRGRVKVELRGRRRRAQDIVGEGEAAPAPENINDEIANAKERVKVEIAKTEKLQQEYEEVITELYKLEKDKDADEKQVSKLRNDKETVYKQLTAQQDAQWQCEEELEQLLFSRDQQNINQQLQLEQEHDAQAVRNDLGEERFDCDEPVPSDAALQALARAEKHVLAIGRVHGTDDVYKKGEVCIKETADIKVEKKDELGEVMAKVEKEEMEQHGAEEVQEDNQEVIADEQQAQQQYQEGQDMAYYDQQQQYEQQLYEQQYQQDYYQQEYYQEQPYDQEQQPYQDAYDTQYYEQAAYEQEYNQYYGQQQQDPYNYNQQQQAQDPYQQNDQLQYDYDYNYGQNAPE